MTALPALLLGGLTVSASAPAAAPEQKLAVVVGWNAAPRAELPTLRYADDDAVRWTVLLQTFGAKVELLTDLDADSRKLYGDTLPVPARPTRSALRSAMDRVARQVAAAKAAGGRTVLYFVYAGHGDVDDGQGYVALADGRFFRSDLENEVLARSAADINHVVVDACRSFYFVYGRGPGGRRKPWHGSYFSAGAGDRFPNTGFLLSSSSGAPSHEWEEFQSGVFSHEVRSGLLGGADADRDGRVTYREIAAFVRVANMTIRNERFRPSVLARPPPERDAVLLDLRAAGAGEIQIERSTLGRQVLEDPIGVRWADLHSGSDSSVTLRLPAIGWSRGHFYLRSFGREVEYRIPAHARTTLASIAPERPTATRRGAVHEAFLQLFERPFDAGALGLPPDLSAEAVFGEADEPGFSSRQKTALALAGAGVAGLAAAGGLWWSTRALRKEGLDPLANGERRDAINGRIRERNLWGALAAGGGAALIGAGVGLWLWDPRSRDLAGAILVPVPGGGVVAWRLALR